MNKASFAKRRVRLCVAALAPALIGLLALVPAAEAAAPPVVVTTSSLGKILVNGRGLTVYMFAGDSKDMSTCAGPCAANWPPVIVKSTSVTKAPGVTAKLGTTKRSDGTLQLTVNGWPVYTFMLDTAKGDLAGQGVKAFGAKWWVLSPSGVRITKATGAATSQPSTGAGGYEY